MNSFFLWQEGNTETLEVWEVSESSIGGSHRSEGAREENAEEHIRSAEQAA